MSENIYSCACGFKCIQSQLSKTKGACPKCGKRIKAMKDLYGDEVIEQTNFNKLSRGEI